MSGQGVRSVYRRPQTDGVDPTATGEINGGGFRVVFRDGEVLDPQKLEDQATVAGQSTEKPTRGFAPLKDALSVVYTNYKVRLRFVAPRPLTNISLGNHPGRKQNRRSPLTHIRIGRTCRFASK